MVAQGCSGTLTSALEIGAGVSIQAEVPDPRHMYINVGLGFYAECSLTEALQAAVTMRSCHSERLERLKAHRTTVHKDLKEVESTLAALKSIEQDFQGDS